MAKIYLLNFNTNWPQKMPNLEANKGQVSSLRRHLKLSHDIYTATTTVLCTATVLSVSTQSSLRFVTSDVKSSRPKFWPRPRSFDSGLGLEVLASFNITVRYSDQKLGRICQTPCSSSLKGGYIRVVQLPECSVINRRQCGPLSVSNQMPVRPQCRPLTI